MSFKLEINEFSSGDWKPWDSLGLLEKLEEKERMELGVLMSDMFKYLHEKEIMKDGDISPKKDGFSNVVTLVFPALRRVYVKVKDKNIDIENLYKKLSEFYKINRSSYLELCAMNVDGEAKLCADFSDMMIDKLNNK